MPDTDSILEYTVAWNRCQGHCRLRSFSTPIGRVVVFTELADNPGPSVTNAALELIRLAANTFGFSIEDTVWVEEYGPESYPEGRRDREFARIRIGSGTPEWQHLPTNLVLDWTGIESLDFR